MKTQKYNKAKFQKLVSKNPSGFLESHSSNLQEKKNRLRSAKLALSILTILDHNNMSQLELAKKMNVSPQQISKLLKGKNNFTFDTIGKLEDALGQKLIEICTIDFERENRKAEFVMKEMTERTLRVRKPKLNLPQVFMTKKNFENIKTVTYNGFNSFSEADNNLQPTG